MKSDRQQAIVKLVNTANVHNQEELQQLLEIQGMSVTQATLSRDVNELGLVKCRANDGSLCYCIRKMDSFAPNTAAEGIVSVEMTGAFAVVKTHPGFASVVATTIDRAQMNAVMGTIAGDDTILVIVRPKADIPTLISSFENIFPGIENKIC